MKFTIFMTVLCVIFIIAKVTTRFYVESVPLLAVYQKPLTVLIIVTGTIAGVFILLKAIKEIKEIFSNGKSEE